MISEDINERKLKSAAIFQAAFNKILPQMRHQFVATEDIIKIERRYDELHAEAVAGKDVWRELQAVANQWGLAVLMADMDRTADIATQTVQQMLEDVCVKAEPCQINLL